MPLVIKGTTEGWISDIFLDIFFFLMIHNPYNSILLWYSPSFKNCSRYCMFCFLSPQVNLVHSSSLGEWNCFWKRDTASYKYRQCLSSKVWVLSIWATFHILWPPSCQRTALVQEALFPKASSKAHAHCGKMKDNTSQAHLTSDYRAQNAECH